jgi:hypothetical protein
MGSYEPSYLHSAGARQDVLISGRTIAAHIQVLEKEIKMLIPKVKDAKQSDKLLRPLEALRNYSVQLKILSAVKAAGIRFFLRLKC